MLISYSSEGNPLLERTPMPRPRIYRNVRRICALLDGTNFAFVRDYAHKRDTSFSQMLNLVISIVRSKAEKIKK